MSSSDLQDSFEFLLIEDNPGDERLLRELLKEGSFCPHVAVVNDSNITKPLDWAQFARVIHAIQDFWLAVVKLAPA